VRRASLTLLVALAVLASCVPPETDPIRRFSADTPLGELQETGTMRIAVDTDWLPFGSDAPTEPRGFAVDLGAFVAREMGMEAELIAASSADEVASLVNGGEAALGFAAFELTEENVRDNSLTDPFFIAHQRLLVPAGSDIEEIDDLEGREVCQVVDEITGVSAADLIDGASVASTSDLRGCITGLEREETDAVFAPDGHLLRSLEPDGNGGAAFELTGDDQTTVGWAAITSPELSGLVGHFNDSLAEAKSDGDWSRWYARWIEPLTGESEPEPPGLSLEEAAALFPSALVDQG